MSVQMQLESSRNLTTDDFITTDLKKTPALASCENEIADLQKVKKRKRGRRRPLADIQNKPEGHQLEGHQPDGQRQTKRARVENVKLIDSIVHLKDGTCTAAENVQRHQFNLTITWSAKD
ncbi:hypothetical protein BVRB_021700 [Beta vulgaris subsp. vulgaris]|uniref:Uncharacterized protein n=1 Tax=Beta vulgaris subsp. vulgaris TaxID=3555 RepID=A0A0J8B075_BETVV|nr:hypothetical protein BVRB_021700 [Beta vulgaris subsp. vulgaris]